MTTFKLGGARLEVSPREARVLETIDALGFFGGNKTGELEGRRSAQRRALQGRLLRPRGSRHRPRGSRASTSRAADAAAERRRAAWVHGSTLEVPETALRRLFPPARRGHRASDDLSQVSGAIVTALAESPIPGGARLPVHAPAHRRSRAERPHPTSPPSTRHRILCHDHGAGRGGPRCRCASAASAASRDVIVMSQGSSRVRAAPGSPRSARSRESTASSWSAPTASASSPPSSTPPTPRAGPSPAASGCCRSPGRGHRMLATSTPSASRKSSRSATRPASTSPTHRRARQGPRDQGHHRVRGTDQGWPALRGRCARGVARETRGRAQGGKSEAGQAASMSHTGALGGAVAAYDAAFRAAGAVQ